MKNFLYILITSSMLFLSNIKQANANIVFDLTEIASEVSEIVGKITDAAGKITNSVNMVKQALTQGSTKEQLLNLVKNVAGNYVKGFIGEKFANEVQKAADKKNQAVIEQEKESYEASTEEEIKEKQKEAEKQLAEVMLQIGITQTAISSQTIIVNKLRDNCNKVLVIGRKEYCDKYRKERAELDRLHLLLADLNKKQNELKEIIIELNKKKLDIKNQPKIKKLEERVADIEKRIEEKEKEIEEKRKAKEAMLQAIKDQVEWDSTDNPALEDFKIKEQDYKFFLKDYFYNPDAVEDSAGNKFISHQSARDDVERNRKQLIVNSAAHLMQVSANLRAETTNRRRIIEEYVKTTVEGEGETQSISSYSATKVEYIRALLLYAKMQTAKLQYLSAKELFKTDVTKSYEEDKVKKYLDNDLKRYQLKPNDILNMYKDMKITEEDWR